MDQQPSAKGKEVAPSPSQESQELEESQELQESQADFEFPQRLIRATTRQMLSPTLNIEIGESSSSRYTIPDRNNSNIVLEESRRASAQRRRRWREQENAGFSNTELGESSSSRNNPPPLNTSTYLDRRSMMPQSSNIVLGDSRRALAQRRRWLRQREDARTIEDEEPIENEEPIANEEVFNQSRHSLGRMSIVCEHCNALHWIDEKLVRSSVNKPKFSMCCSDGQVRLPALRDPPTLLMALYDGSDNRSASFLQHIRQYNSSNAFTSLGCSIDRSVLTGRGPYSFIIHGELRHRTGALLPHPDKDPMYAQLYIYDPMTALDTRERRNPSLDRQLLSDIQQCLLQNNQFVRLFRQAHEVLEEESQDNSDQNLHAHLRYDRRTDQRRYNAPTVDEIAVILPGDGTEKTTTRDIVLYYRHTPGLVRISECHPAYAPLHYVLLFPFGELGWEPGMTLWDVRTKAESTKQRNRLTMMDYYSYRLFQRRSEYSTILRAQKLFQEFLVDAWAATEQNRLEYIRENQGLFFRFERYKDLQEISPQRGATANQIGTRRILPSSFTGGPRQMYEIFQDSMSITRAYGHPDIFLTMTANPAWPEISDALLPNQTAADRPDLVARVFELKRRHLLKIVKNERVFGRIEAYLFVIEFQKRGLPHMHALFFLAAEDKIKTPEQVDRVVCAELPDPVTKPALFDTIKRCMIHGPCGARNSSSPCMENGFCKKRYPKLWAETTSIDNDGYPIYRRRDIGVVVMVRGKEVDNRDVVPYNPYLSEIFNCHINVEVCAGMTCVKYINKYIYKGNDRTTMVLGRDDEIQHYLDARYIGPPEAAWRLFGYTLHEECPNVVRLDLHLPGEHNITYDSRRSLDEIVQQADGKVTKLMAFFNLCASDQRALDLTYQQVPEYYTWQGNNWKRRNPAYTSNAIGRIYFASPSSGERFYLRLLLITFKGPTSFEHLRTYNGVQHPMFKDACASRGLLEDDEEWMQCLEEASVMKTGYQLRRLFALILIQCSPLQPDQLWIKFAMNICDDLSHKLRTEFGIPNPSDNQITDYGLYLLNEILQESGKCLKDFPPMPLPLEDWRQIMGNNRLLWEHAQLRHNVLTSFRDHTYSILSNIDLPFCPS